MAKNFDVVIFGASGYTGEFVVNEMAKNASEENIRWAVAGRNRHKVKQTLEKVQRSAPVNLKEIEIFEADVTDYTSLENMCKNTKLVINCVGPYEKFGEPVVLACLKHKTHLIDMTIEIMYINRMILQYYREAESQEVYVVSACGIGYLPVEMMIPFLQQNLEGGISVIDVYVKLSRMEAKSVHFGTWDSGVRMCNSYYEIIDARQKICSQILNRYKSKRSILSPSWPFKFSKEVEGIGLLVPSIYHTVPLSLDMKEGVLHKKSIKLNTYISVSSWPVLIRILIFLFLIIFLLPFSFGKRLLLRYPEVFSFGVVSKSDSSEKKDVITAQMICVAKGWSKKQHSDEKILGAPDKTITVHTSKPTCYRFTAVCLVQSAVTVLKETDRLPNRGGIYTPLAAFSETSLVSRLERHGLRYEVKKY